MKVKIQKRLDEMAEGGGRVKPTFSAAEWEAARKKFKEREDGRVHSG